MELDFWPIDQTTASTTPGDPDASMEMVTDASIKHTEAEAPTLLVPFQELVDAQQDAVATNAKRYAATSHHVVAVVTTSDAFTEHITIKINPIYIFYNYNFTTDKCINKLIIKLFSY